MNIVSLHVRFCFALNLEWSLNTSIDKNQMQFEYFQTCILIWSVVQTFFSLILFTVDMQEKKAKKANR